jgi:MinD-like ATPase involved in chromosome partitioning or flagellar assembly
MSTKGGVGKTTIATNLALALQNFNRQTVLFDFNFTSPHVSLYLNFLNAEKTLNNFLKNECNFNEILYKHSSGLTLVPTSLNLKDVANVDLNLKNVIEENLKNFEFVIIDSAPGLGKEALISLNSCNEIIFVANPDLLSIFDIAKTYKFINSLENKPIVWGIILNKVSNKPYELRKEEVEKYTGLPVLASIKENKKFIESLNERIPAYFFDSKVREEFNLLAAKIAGIPYERKSLIERIIGRFLKRI